METTVKRRIQRIFSDIETRNFERFNKGTWSIAVRISTRSQVGAHRLLKRADIEEWKDRYLMFVEDSSDDDEQAQRDQQIATRKFDALR